MDNYSVQCSDNDSSSSTLLLILVYKYKHAYELVRPQIVDFQKSRLKNSLDEDV